MQRTATMGIFLTLLCALIHCGSPSSQADSAHSKKEIAKIKVAVLPNTLGMNIELAPSVPPVEAATYTISMTGCVSGLVSSATQVSAYLPAYLGDINCMAKLTALGYRDINWVMSSNRPFTTYKVGDTSIFVNPVDTTGQTQLLVTIGGQLSNPVKSTDQVSYTFVEQQPGPSTPVGQIQAQVQMSVMGQGAPAFAMQSANMVGITANGAGQFVFTFQCDQPVTVVNGIPYCHANALNATSYVLAANTYTLPMSFSTLGTLIGRYPTAVSLTTDYIPPSTGIPNGGFTTKIGAGALIGPAPLQSNPNLLLILANGGAYQLFSIKLALY
jgi:hypothetical protein